MDAVETLKEELTIRFDGQNQMLNDKIDGMFNGIKG
jgi:hypothetical protein